MAQSVCELLRLAVENCLKDLKIKWNKTIRLYQDNKFAISIAHNPIHHDKTKHIEINKHFIKKKLDNKQISTPYVPIYEQLSDVFTKGLNNHDFAVIISNL